MMSYYQNLETYSNGKMRNFDQRSTFLMTALLIDLMVLPRLPTRGLLGSPVHLAYLAAPLGFIVCLRQRELFRYAIPALVMIGAIVCGAIIGEMLFDLPLRQNLTDRSSLIWYMILPCFMGVGYALSKGRIPYKIVLICLWMSAILTILMTYHPALSPHLLRTYSISERVTGHYLKWRSPGIQNGVLKSTCTANIIFLILVIGAMRKECPSWFVLLGIIPTLTHHLIMSSRSGLGLLVLILIGYFLRPGADHKSSLTQRSIYVMFFMTFIGLLIWWQWGTLSKYSRQVTQIELMVERTTESITNTESEDFILNRVKGHLLPRAIARWMKSPIIGTGLAQVEGREPFGYRGFHNDFLIILATGGIVGLVAILILVYRIFRLNPILFLPFILPGLTNAFITAIPSALIYGLLIGFLVGKDQRASYVLQESSEADEADEEKVLAAASERFPIYAKLPFDNRLGIPKDQP